MWILKIIKKLLKIPIIKLKLGFSAKFSKYSFFKKWSKLKPQERDKIRERIINNNKEIKRLQELSLKPLKKILIKEVNNVFLSSYENLLLEEYKNLFLNEKEPIIKKYNKGHFFDVANSSWISTVIYYPDTKKVKLLIENKNGTKKWYNFFNVPKTKYLALIELGGKYMWDYFGKHYSLNPTHWIRKNEIKRS